MGQKSLFTFFLHRALLTHLSKILFLTLHSVLWAQVFLFFPPCTPASIPGPSAFSFMLSFQQLCSLHARVRLPSPPPPRGKKGLWLPDVLLAYTDHQKPGLRRWAGLVGTVAGLPVKLWSWGDKPGGSSGSPITNNWVNCTAS